MVQVNLSKRLTAIANELKDNKILADIGTDHAYLPCYAYIEGIIPAAIATEVNEGPFHSAETYVTKLNLKEVIEVRFGDGLAVLEEGEMQQVTIAGMGGVLIASILEKGKSKLRGVERLVLQPNVAEPQVRKWLYDNDWTVINELLIEEEEKYYEIIVAEQGKDHEYQHIEKEMLFGRFLLQERPVAFRKKWKVELEKQRLILKELQKASHASDVREKRQQVKKTIQLIKEVLS